QIFPSNLRDALPISYRPQNLRSRSLFLRRSAVHSPQDQFRSFFSQANTSPGAPSGSTTRFLLSAVNVIVGLSHNAESGQNALSIQGRFTYENRRLDLSTLN